MTFHRARCLFVLAIALAPLAGSLRAAVPDDPQQRQAIIGQPTSLKALPEKIVLNGARSVQQVVVTGHYADGAIRDLSAFATFSLENPALATLEQGFLTARASGTTNLVIKAGNAELKVPLEVKAAEQPRPVSFRNEVIASLNVAGCNAGACHGTPSGKNGFKLSLRGFDPPEDFLQLTRDVLGRRTDRLTPESSLMLQKGLGRVPHEGGQRLATNGIPHLTVKKWLEEGLRDDPADLPHVVDVEILPATRVLVKPSRWQQLSVMAKFSDGTVRDVTRLTVFSSSDTGVAEVDQLGFVEFKGPGEVAILCRFLMELRTVRLTYLEPRDGFVWKAPPEVNYVDKHTFAKLKMLSIPPSELCTDQEFLRRVYLDLIGTLPSAAEATEFLNDKDANKRAKLIDTLLERPEYADFWTLKWSDVLRSSRKGLTVKGIHVFQHWLREQISTNRPFDETVRELLTSSGSTFVNPPASYYRITRDPQNLAETTAQLFFGVRLQCAKCHNHPFERWTQDDYYSFAAFFAQVQRKPDRLEPGANPQTPGGEIIYLTRGGDVTQPRTKKVMPPKPLGGPVATVAPGADRREALAQWLTQPGNTFFTRSVANRIWFHLFGKGIVDPVDDFRDSNPSANDELLDALAKDFAANKFDAKKLIRTILLSRTYQLSAQANDLNRDDNRYFSHAYTKLMSAEQLLDAICAVTDVPEKFAGLPAGTRAIQLPDGEINHPFLKTFGQPARELACECEREGDSNLAQALQLINGPTVNEKLRNAQNRIGKLIAAKKTDAEILDDLYLSTLSRKPTEEDVKISLAHLNKSTDKRKAWEDIHWALLNTKEFLFRH
jgi:hypothetical protein